METLETKYVKFSLQCSYFFAICSPFLIIEAFETKIIGGFVTTFTYLQNLYFIFLLCETLGAKNKLTFFIMLKKNYFELEFFIYTYIYIKCVLFICATQLYLNPVHGSGQIDRR